MKEGYDNISRIEIVIGIIDSCVAFYLRTPPFRVSCDTSKANKSIVVIEKVISNERNKVYVRSDGVVTCKHLYR